MNINTINSAQASCSVIDPNKKAAEDVFYASNSLVTGELDAFIPSEHIEQYNNYSASSNAFIALSLEEQLINMMDILKSSDAYVTPLDGWPYHSMALISTSLFSQFEKLVIKSLDQDTLKKALWISINSFYAIDDTMWDLKHEMLDYKADYRAYDIDAILNGSNTHMYNQLIAVANSVIIQKAWRGETTEAERFYNPVAVRVENNYGKNATFANKMQSVADYFDAELIKAGKPSSQDNKFTFRLGSDFKFSVSGGNGGSAEFIADLLNNSKENIYKTIMSIFRHRSEDGSINSWNTKSIPEFVGEYKTVYASNEYTNLMNNILRYYDKFNYEELLRTQYDLQLDDFEILDGVLVGKNAKAEDLIQNSEFFRNHHVDYISNYLKNELPPIDFTLIEFSLEQGRFSIKYT